MSAHKSMTVRFFIHSIAKRAKATTLLDLEATENFMNLSYAKWLKLPIKELAQPRKLFNIDNIENVSGELKHYTDLQVQTENKTTKLCFFLTHIGEQKAILGYPWFTANQPKIDWRQGWIDHTQLPIIFCADNTKWAIFTPRWKTYHAPLTAIGILSAVSQFIQNKQKLPKPTSQMNTSHTKRYLMSKNPKGYPAIRYGTMQSNSCKTPPSHSQIDYSHLRKRK